MPLHRWIDPAGFRDRVPPTPPTTPLLRSRPRAKRFDAAALVLCCACVDAKIEGVSTDLLLLEPPLAAKPGATLNIVFQALDAEGAGVPDQKLEVIITDLSRLTFVNAPAADHQVVSTEHESRARGVQIVGAAVIALAVPATAPAGSVTLVGSLEGERGGEIKTRSVTLMVEARPERDAGAAPPTPDAGRDDSDSGNLNDVEQPAIDAGDAGQE
jgi:hypothetical protein